MSPSRKPPAALRLPKPSAPPKGKGADYPKLPTLRDVRASVLAARRERAAGRAGTKGPTAPRLCRRRWATPPRPWYAVPVDDKDQFRTIRLGLCYVVQVCECDTCALLLVEIIQGRRVLDRGRGQLVLVAPDEQSLLVARGLSALANNVQISRACSLSKAKSSLLTGPESVRVRAGHLVRISLPVLPRMAAYLVGRLPVPTTPVPVPTVSIPAPFVVRRGVMFDPTSDTRATNADKKEV